MIGKTETVAEAENAAGFKEAYLTFLRRLQSIKEHTKYSDFTINRAARSWKVHKAIVRAHSEYFLKACTGDYKEAQNNSIMLDEEDNENAISSMIHFFYHFDYESSSVFHDIHVYIVSDKYLVPTLSSIALERVRSWAGTQGIDIGSLNVVKEIYSLDAGHKDVLKPIVLQRIGEQHQLLRESRENHAFHESLRKVDGFAVDILAVAAAKMTPAARKYQCPDCETIFSVHTKLTEFHCPKCENREDDCPAGTWKSYAVNPRSHR